MRADLVGRKVEMAELSEAVENLLPAKAGFSQFVGTRAPVKADWSRNSRPVLISIGFNGSRAMRMHIPKIYHTPP